jgi:hypothetical protein
MLKSLNVDWRNCAITITDTDFVEVVRDEWNPGYGDFHRCWNAVVDVYEKRNFNIMRNLVLMMIWYEKSYGRDLNTIISWVKKDANYKTYAEELDKYLLLM